jgi:ABC-type transporter Mla subunit MlaD
MTIDQQIERLLSAVSTLADVSQRNSQNISRLANIAELHQRTSDMHQQNFNAVLGEIREMQAEVRGLQTENRRILDQLLNRTDNQA